MESTKIIRDTNDLLRKALPCMPAPHRVVFTQGIHEKFRQLKYIVGLLEKIRDFDEFPEEDDPHKEHDFGTLYFMGEKIYWKFDYYNATFDEFEENGTRVMTVMLASEY